MIFLPAAWERLELAFKLGGYSRLSLPCVLQGLACRGRGGGGVGAGELNIAKTAVGMQQSLQEQAEMVQELLLRPFIVKIDAHMSAPGHTDAAF